jgi:hypothetical protein
VLVSASGVCTQRSGWYRALRLQQRMPVAVCMGRWQALATRKGREEALE